MGILSSNDSKISAGGLSPAPTTKGILSANDAAYNKNIYALGSARSIGAYRAQQDKVDALNSALQSGDTSKMYPALTKARSEGTITKEQQIDYLKQIGKSIQESGEARIKEIYSPKSIASEVGSTVVNLPKTMIGGIQQMGGNIADAAIQAGVVSRDIYRNLNPGKSEQKKADERASDVATAEYLRNWIHKQTDITGAPIVGTSGADEAARNILSGKATAKDYAKVGLTGLKVGTDTVSFANPLVGATKGTLAYVGRDVFNNFVIGALGGAAQAGASDEDIVKGALQGGLSSAAISGLGGAFSLARGKTTNLSQALTKAKLGKNISEAVPTGKTSGLTARKTFAPLDATTTSKIDNLVSKSNAEPIKSGYTRLYQTADNITQKSDQYFKDTDILANYINGRAENAKLSFVDVPNESVKSVAGKPSVFKISEAPTITPIGEQRVAGAALKTEAQTGQELASKATYTVESYKANKISADDFAKNNKNEALKVVNGQADTSPAKMQETYKALDKLAKETGDVDLAQQLASSKAPTELSEAAQALGQRGYDIDPTSPTDAIRKIRDDASRVVESRTKTTLKEATAKEMKKITSQIKTPTKEDWSGFIESLRCK